MALIQSIRAETYDRRLRGRAANVYSQYGEDGLIHAVLREIGYTNRWCFEIGAADGVFYSNTKHLRDNQWSAVLIEKCIDQYEKLLQYESHRVLCIHEDCRDLDSVLTGLDEFPYEPDFGCIDIDGQDYWLWHDMQLIRPRVVLIEFHWADGDTFIPPRNPDMRAQAGEQAVRDLGRNKGYVCVAKTHVNLLFVDADTWGVVA